MKTKAFLFLSVLVAATTAKKRVEDTGSIVFGNTPEQFAAQIIAAFEACIKVVSTAKLKFD